MCWFLRLMAAIAVLACGCDSHVIVATVPRVKIEPMKLVVPVSTFPPESMAEPVKIKPKAEECKDDEGSPVFGGLTKEEVIQIFEELRKKESDKAGGLQTSAGSSSSVERRSPPGPVLQTVTVYYPEWCLYCRHGAKAIMDASMNQEVLRFEFITDMRVFPDALKARTTWSNPVLYWPDPTSPTGWRSQEGFTTLLDLLKAMDAARQPSPPQSPSASPNRGKPPNAKATARRLLLEQDWRSLHTWPGDLREHLAAKHGYDASAMTDEQAVALHDSIHEAEKSARRQRRARFWRWM